MLCIPTIADRHSFPASATSRFQLVVQVGTFASLFLMMFETYPFRVGLMGMLTSQYLTVYIINVVYFITTGCVYGYRLVRDPPDRFDKQRRCSSRTD